MPESAPQTQPIGAPIVQSPPEAAAPQLQSDAVDAETPERQEASASWSPPETRDQYDRMVRQSLLKQKQQLEPQLRESVLAEVQPQLDELTQIKDSQKTEFEKLTGKLETLSTENMTLAEKAAAADRKDLIYAVLADREQRLPTKFWPLIEGTTPEEVTASIDSLMEDAKGLAGVPVNGSVAPEGAPQEVGLGSPASPPANPQPRPAQPQSLEERAARLDAMRRGDPEAVAANIKQHLPQVGPRA